MTTKNLLLGILIIAVFAVGFLIGRITANSPTDTPNNQTSTMNGTNTQAKSTSTTTTTPTTASSISANMSADQIKMLQALGIDVNKVTPAMIACAETSLGSSRTEEIKNGATPSFSEGVKLVACYK